MTNQHRPSRWFLNLIYILLKTTVFSVLLGATAAFVGIIAGFKPDFYGANAQLMFVDGILFGSFLTWQVGKMA